MAATCAISGQVPDEPVVSVKSGYVYEKRLIFKHLQATGKDPKTQEVRKRLLFEWFVRLCRPRRRAGCEDSG